MNPAIREAVLWRPTLHDGISLNFQTGQHYVKAIGGVLARGALTDFFTFTGGNQSMYMGPAGLLVQSVTNTPRIEYDASGNCLGLLMEASRTNLALQSQDLSTSHSLAALLAFGSGSTANAIAAPDGTVTADKIVEDTSTTLHRIRQTTDVTITSGATVTFSYHVKAAERTKCRLRITESTFASAYEVSFDLTAGTVGAATTTGVASGGTSRIVALPNGWYRISISAAINGGFLTCRTNLELENAAGSNAYTGDGASGLYAWGEQIEVGAFPSSYIPTTTVAVARTADSCIRTLGSEFSATAGTVIVQGRQPGGNSTSRQPVFSFDDGTANNRIPFVRPGSSSLLQLRIDAGGANQSANGDTVTNFAEFKAAGAWQSNDVAFVLNAGVIQTDAVATIPTVTTLGLGYESGSVLQMNGHIRRFDYYPTRLPNADLIRLAA